MSWQIKAIAFFISIVGSWMLVNLAFTLTNKPSTTAFLGGLAILFALLMFWLVVAGQLIREIIVSINKKEETKQNGKEPDRTVH